MSIKNVLKMGNQQLGTPSRPVTDFSPEFLNPIIKDMQDTMQEKKGVGIAAPQIGYHFRIIMFGFDTNSRYPQEKPVPFTVLINPTIKILSEETADGWEGCLSVPGLRGVVPRYTAIEYQGYTLQQQLLTRKAVGFHARVVQHEYDHIEGILFPQRIKNMQLFGFEEELHALIWPNQPNPR